MPEPRTTIPTHPTPSTCHGPHCGRPILWVMTLGGTRMPLDPDPTEDGTIIPVTGPDGTVRARVLAGHEPDRPETAWVPHHRTCPDSSHYQRRKAAAAPACGARCGTPLAPALLELGYTRHPGCMPDPVPARRVPSGLVQCGEALPGLDGHAGGTS